MDETKRRILVVEQDQIMRDNFIKAFLHSGYYVQGTDKLQEAVAMIGESNENHCPFDLVLLDIADKGRLLISNVLQRISDTPPVLMLKDTQDKLLLIDRLSRKQNDFLEEFIEINAKTFQSDHYRPFNPSR